MDFKGRIVMYTLEGCPHCTSTKTKLTRLNLPFHEIVLNKNPVQKKIMLEITGKRTVPQIFFNEKLVSFNKLTATELNELIAYVKDNPAPANAPKLPEPKDAPKKKERKDTSQSLSEYSTAVGATSEPIIPTVAEEDEASALVKEFKATTKAIRTHRKKIFIPVAKSFFGRDIVKFVEEKKNFDIDDAIKLGQDFIKKKLIVPTDGRTPLKYNKTLYRLVEDRSKKALNAGYPYYGRVTDAAELSTKLRTIVLSLYAKYLSADGKSVNYKGIGKSKEFKTYVSLTFQLQRLSLDKLSRNQLLAFFINIYNALVIHGDVEYGFPENFLQRFKFFSTTRYIIGGYTYCLQDIENGVLRGNRKGLGMTKKPFSNSDPRIKYLVQPNEPLVHFALVCGANSCPPIKTYSSEEVIEELTLAAEAFLEDDEGCVVDKTNNEIKLSRIFKWYKEDFGSSEKEILKWVKKYLPESEKLNDLNTVIASGKCKLHYLHYDWGTNIAKCKTPSVRHLPGTK